MTRRSLIPPSESCARRRHRVGPLGLLPGFAPSVCDHVVAGGRGDSHRLGGRLPLVGRSLLTPGRDREPVVTDGLPAAAAGIRKNRRTSAHEAAPSGQSDPASRATQKRRSCRDASAASFVLDDSARGRSLASLPLTCGRGDRFQQLHRPLRTVPRTANGPRPTPRDTHRTMSPRSGVGRDIVLRNP